MKPHRLIYTFLIAAGAVGVPGLGWSITLGEFYKLPPDSQTMYLVGVYDSNVIEYRKDSKRSICLQELGGPGFIRAVSNFVVSLSADSGAKERQAYDAMNVALLSALVIDKSCGLKMSK